MWIISSFFSIFIIFDISDEDLGEPQFLHAINIHAEIIPDLLEPLLILYCDIILYIPQLSLLIFFDIPDLLQFSVIVLKTINSEFINAGQLQWINSQGTDKIQLQFDKKRTIVEEYLNNIKALSPD